MMMCVENDAQKNQNNCSKNCAAGGTITLKHQNGRRMFHFIKCFDTSPAFSTAHFTFFERLSPFYLNSLHKMGHEIKLKWDILSKWNQHVF